MVDLFSETKISEYTHPIRVDSLRRYKSNCPIIGMNVDVLAKTVRSIELVPHFKYPW